MNHTNQMVSVPRELLEQALDAAAAVGMHDVADELDRILTPAPEQHQGEPVQRDERVAFEAAYAREFNRARGQDISAEEIALMRDNRGGYGDRAYLNGQWAGWQARAALDRLAACEVRHG